MKKIFTLQAFIFISLITVPLLASAATNVTQGFTTFGSLVDTFTNSIVKSLTTLFATAAMAAFFFGIAQYVWGIRAGVAKQIEDGQKFMIWGLVALFVMFSVWGIVQWTQGIFGIRNQSTIVIPSIQIGNGGGTGTGGTGSGGSGTGTGGAGTGSGTGSGSGGASGLIPDGYSCFSGAECVSGYCSPRGNCETTLDP